MKPVDCHRGRLELLFDGGEERRRHVANYLDDVFRTAFMGFNERAELSQAFLALTWSREDHGPVGTIQVNEDGDVIVPTLGRGLIQTDGLDVFQVQRIDGFGHIVMDDAPQAGIRDLDMTRYGIDRHLSNEAHDNLLKKQGKPAAFPGPWGFDASDSMFRAIDPRQSGCEVTVMLEEVEMPPREFLEVVSLARGSALGTRIQRSAVGTDLQVELGWRMVGIKTLAHNFPGRREAEAQGKDFFSLHGSPPKGGLSKLIEVGQFHIKRRRTINMC